MSAPREVVHRESEPGLLVFLSTELDKAAARLAGLGVFLSGELDKTAARMAGKTLAVFIAAYPKVSPDEPPARSQVRGARAGLGAVVEAIDDTAGEPCPSNAAEEEARPAGSPVGRPAPGGGGRDPAGPGLGRGGRVVSAPDDFLYRETALCRFPDPEERETLRRFGSLVLSWAVGAEHSAEGRDTPTGSQIAPVAADLRHLASYLRMVVEEVEGAVVETRESHLAHLATGWARRADALAREVEAAVEAAEGGATPVAASARAARDLTDEEIRRLADRCSWIRQALREARGVEAALQAIPQDGPDPELHRHLLVRASDLGTELELLLKNEGCPTREGEA